MTIYLGKQTSVDLIIYKYNKAKTIMLQYRYSCKKLQQDMHIEYREE